MVGGLFGTEDDTHNPSSRHGVLLLPRLARCGQQVHADCFSGDQLLLFTRCWYVKVSRVVVVVVAPLLPVVTPGKMLFAVT